MTETTTKTWNRASAESFNQRMFSFSGRLNRLLFFTRWLFVEIGGTILIIALMVAGAILPLLGIFLFAAMVIVAIAMVVATYALMTRRLHDMGFNGSWVLIFFFCNILAGRDSAIRAGELTEASVIGLLASVITAIFFLLLLFWPGEEGPNAYGPDPLQGGALAVPGPQEYTGRRPNDPIPPARPSQPITGPASANTGSRTPPPMGVNKAAPTGGRGTRIKVARKN